MIRALLILAALSRLALAACDPTLTPCSISSNGSFDILGTPLAPMGTGGTESFNITFSPPPGYSVRILRVYGDFAVIPEGTPAAGFAGTLFGLSSTAPGGSKYATFAADNCMLYVQVFTRGEAARAAYDDATELTLEADNNLVVKTAVFMNTLGLDIHMEPSFVVVYQFVSSLKPR